MRLRLLPLLLLCLTMTAPPASAQRPVAGASELAGLWRSVRRLGPDVRGEIWVAREGAHYVAEISGRRATAQLDGQALSFALPGGAGAFRGRLEGTRIVGHWIQPAATLSGVRYASPLTLERHGGDRWRGEVAPLDDGFAFYLMVTPQADGGARAFIRNPERNLGIFIGAERLEREGDRVRLLGRRFLSPSRPEEVVLEGRYNGEDQVLSFYIGGRGGHYDFERVDAESDAGFSPRLPDQRAYRYAPPPALNDGWPVATLAQEGIDEARISAFVQALIEAPIDSARAPDVHAVLIARRGRLVLEEYFHGFHRNRAHDTRSAAKSLTSLLAGAAILAGADISPSTAVYERLGAPIDDPRKRGITFEHLLTMSSGYHCDDSDDTTPGHEDVVAEQTEDADLWRYTLNLPMIRAPGTLAVYCSINPNLAGAVIARGAGAWLPDLFSDRIARPMRFGRYYLNLMPSGEAYMGGGVYLLPRDFLKLGQLVVGDGVWRGRRIVSADWIRRSTAPSPWPIGARGYGYLWWIEDMAYGDGGVRVVEALGNGGQAVFAVPELDLVVAFNGGNYQDGRTSNLNRSEYMPRILAAVER